MCHKLTDAQKALVEANLGIARLAVFRNISAIRANKIELDDAYGIACLGLVKAAPAYNPDIAKASSFFYRSAVNEIMMEIRRQRRVSYMANTLPYDLEDGKEAAYHEDRKALPPDRAFEVRSVLDAIKSALSEREFTALLLDRVERINQTEIGTRIGVSQSMASRIIKRADAKARAAVA